MLRIVRSFSGILVVVVLAACGSGAPVRQDGAAPEDAAAKLEPPVPRPVVPVERAAAELQATVALLKEGNFRQAEANLEEILKARPDLAEAHFNLGYARQQLKKCEEAIPPLQQGLKLKPNEVRAYNLIAICERTLGRFADAERTYQNALLLFPDDADLNFNVGILYELYLFKPELALKHYRKFQSLQPLPDAKVAGWITQLERKEVK
jgi:tetratricopeptide (TPR) repeat protein